MEDHAANRQRYLKIANELGELVSEKNKAYGSSFLRGCEILRILYPNGVPVEAYPDMLSMIRIVDKMFRIATDINAFGESPWRDIMGYAVLSADFHENRRQDYTGTAAQPEASTPASLRPGKEPYPVFQSDSWPDYVYDTQAVNIPNDPDKPRVCPACSHDHARSEKTPGSCLYAVANTSSGPRYCGCLGPGTGPAPHTPIEPNITAVGILDKCPKCATQTMRHGVCYLCGPIGHHEANLASWKEI